MEISNHTTAIRLLNNNVKVEYVKTKNGRPFLLINLPLFLTTKIEAYLNYFHEGVQ